MRNEGTSITSLNAGLVYDRKNCSGRLFGRNGTLPVRGVSFESRHHITNSLNLLFGVFFFSAYDATELRGHIHTVGRVLGSNQARRDGHEEDTLLPILGIELGNGNVECALTDGVRGPISD